MVWNPKNHFLEHSRKSIFPWKFHILTFYWMTKAISWLFTDFSQLFLTFRLALFDSEASPTCRRRLEIWTGVTKIVLFKDGEVACGFECHVLHNIRTTTKKKKPREGMEPSTSPSIVIVDNSGQNCINICAHRKLYMLVYFWHFITIKTVHDLDLDQGSKVIICIYLDHEVT